MKNLLKDDFTAFSSALNEPAVRGIRVNTLKIPLRDFLTKKELELTPLTYCDDGFIAENAEKLGNTPAHHAGEIYVQDPGAMSALSALDIKEGWWVLDLCAAPGGKSAQAAAKIGESGFLLSNEYVPKRAKICVGNFERLGIRNAMVTSLDTGEFKKYFNSAFDLVIADAPCSGEGMFRKSDTAENEWSEENVKACAERQRVILENAAGLVRSGGYLLYSTCTYSVEENEAVVDAFLEGHPDYELVPVKEELARSTCDGIRFEGAKCNALSLTRRFYPHVSRGEGQFVALMRRTSTEVMKTILYKGADKDPTRAEVSAVEEFFRDNLVRRPEGKLRRLGENLVLISHACPPLPHSVFSSGVLVGELKNGTFRPAHQFFSAYGTYFIRKEQLQRDDARLGDYLLGCEIDASDPDARGYIAVCYGETPIGGGKVSGGKIKNHYPKGLRLNKQ